MWLKFTVALATRSFRTPKSKKFTYFKIYDMVFGKMYVFDAKLLEKYFLESVGVFKSLQNTKISPTHPHLDMSWVQVRVQGGVGSGIPFPGLGSG